MKNLPYGTIKIRPMVLYMIVKSQISAHTLLSAMAHAYTLLDNLYFEIAVLLRVRNNYERARSIDKMGGL